jgi:predicted PurR-regulated permease PerM
MSEGTSSPGSIDLQAIAAATAVVIGMVAAAAVAYLLLDILLLLFVGIVVATALQPWHLVLCRWGVPKGLAVLLIYLFLLVGLVLIVLAVGPVLVGQIDTFAAEMPRTYADVRAYLQHSATTPFHLIGQQLPPFERLTRTFPDVAPRLYQGALGATASIVRLPVYFVSVLAVGFYWTMEVPRFERLLLSLLAVERRPRTLNIWHEIESKLGGFMRAQGLVMLSVGAASAVGYALIGLPNVLALAVLAGLLEAMPLIGPLLAVAPAVLVALPFGAHTVFLVIGLAMLLQLVESNVLIPHIMHRAIGVSALVGLLAILAFGTLYGIVGVFVAIPMIAVIQVLLDTIVVNAEPVAEPVGLGGSPWDDLRARTMALRQQARVRLRARTSRMGIDPATADHVVDAVDQQIEVTVARVERLISVAEETSKPLTIAAQAAIVEKLQGAAEQIEQAIEHVVTIVVPIEDGLGVSGPTLGLAAAEPSRTAGRGERAATSTETHGPSQGAEPGVIAANLDRAAQRFEAAVEDVESLVVAAQEESRDAHTQEATRVERE